MTPEEVRAHFAAEQVGILATVTPAGAPHLVPVVFSLDGEEIVTVVDAKPKRSGTLQRLTNLAAEPRVCLLVHHYEDDWRRLWWARADGVAEVISTGPRRDQAVARLRERYPQYANTEIDGPAIVVHVTRWSGWAP
jgi:PPOX class probable F420-dependent enzyme